MGPVFYVIFTGFVLLWRHLEKRTEPGATVGNKSSEEEKKMTNVSARAVMSQVDAELSAPQLTLPDADSTAEVALTEALGYCAQKMGLAGSQAVVDRLRQGDRSACKYCHYSIAKHVAGSIGALDENVKAVYVVDFDATPEDLCFYEGARPSLIHLIVWAERKTGALDSLVGALDRALVERYNDVIGTCQLTHLLDVQVVDDADVNNRVGYGAMLSSLHQRPIQVWKR
jgi:hypothetical protein